MTTFPEPGVCNSWIGFMSHDRSYRKWLAENSYWSALIGDLITVDLQSDWLCHLHVLACESQIREFMLFCSMFKIQQPFKKNNPRSCESMQQGHSPICTQGEQEKKLCSWWGGRSRTITETYKEVSPSSLLVHSDLVHSDLFMVNICHACPAFANLKTTYLISS